MKSEEKPVGAAMVVGGGIAGMQAALDLAASGVKVYLVESAPAIGGKMVQLDKTFPTNDCATCIISPRLVEVAREPNITVLTNSEVVAAEGGPGNFRVRVKEKARYVDLSKCTGCSDCEAACVLKNRVPSEFNAGIANRSAIYIPFAQAVPRAAVVDPKSCLLLRTDRCNKACVTACQANAIDFDQKDSEMEVEVGAILLAPGYEPYDARLSEEFGFGRYPNVVTSLQFERLLSPSGPTKGHVQRPSDKKEPRKIAFLQCIGSRDQKHPYCSSVCCMYATKEAMLIKEHHPATDVSIFMMDIRSFGKGFEAYYDRARVEQGVKYIRCRPSSLKEVAATKNLVVRYQAEDGGMVEEEFDMVVLSVGMEPAKGAQDLARALDVKLNEDGFCQTSKFAPLDTTRPGIFACGPFVEPCDIPDSVTQASGAAARCLEVIGAARGELAAHKVYPTEIQVDGQEPRIGVFICHCGTNIAGVVDVKSVAEYARTLPHVVYADTTLYACAQDNQKNIKDIIEENNLTRLVVAACTPRTHEPLFQETMREAALNPFLFEMANIRDQCSWVHSKEPDRATEKSKALVRMAVARAALLRPLHPHTIGVNQSALVIGGGLAGLNAALSLAGQGFKAYLVERSGELGGNMRRLRYTMQGQDPQDYLRGLLERVAAQPLIETILNAKVVDTAGFVGNFVSTVERNGPEERGADSRPEKRAIEHGVTIVATGGHEYRGDDYLLGRDDRVVSLPEFEALVSVGRRQVTDARNIVIIQCVGPEDSRSGYCSRICCTTSIKNAIKVKELVPGANIYVLHKDMRTYGFKEKYYTEAREKGVIFVRYDNEHKPKVVQGERRLQVAAWDSAMGEEISIPADLVVVNSAIIPEEGNSELAQTLKVPVTKEGFFLEAHVKLRPVDFSSEGLFVAGLAHYPKFAEETIAQALATSARAATILSQPNLEVGAVVAQVNGAKCAGCLTCVRACPYGVPKITRMQVAEIEPAQCHGCGICVAECPAKAIQLTHYDDRQIIAKSDALLVEVA